MASTRQVQAAKRNVKKAQAAAKSKRTIAHLPKSTRRGLQAEARKGARRGGQAGAGDLRDAMTANPRTASPAQSLADAAQIMKSEDDGSVPVVEDGRLVGMLTDRDIAIRAVAEGVDAQTINVGDVASREPVTI